MSKLKNSNTESISQQIVADSLHIPVVNSTNQIDAQVASMFNGSHMAKISSQVRVADLMIDYSYQRTQIKSKVTKIVNTFDANLLGVFVCSMRENGQIAIIDGGHRYSALMTRGMANATVNALVYFGLSREQEARIFALINSEHTKPHPAEIFKAGVVSGDTLTREINAILQKHDMNVGQGPQNGNIRAVATLKRVYKNAGSEVLDKTLETIKLAYGMQSANYRDQLISALGFLYNRYGNQINVKRMAKVLQGFGNAKSLIIQAQSVSVGNQLITFTTLPAILINKYNVKLRADNKLVQFPLNLLPQQVWSKNK